MKEARYIAHLIQTTIAGRRKGGPHGLRAFRCLATAFLVIAPLGLRAQAPAASGTVITIAGNGLIGFSGDGGPATNAAFNEPYGLAIGPDGTLYVADNGNYRIRAVAPATGFITTVAGNGTFGDTGDGGPATNATIDSVTSIAVDRARHALYLGEANNNRVRKVNLANGVISNYAGLGFFGFGFSGDGASNLNEFLSGTKPNDAASVFRITALQPEGGDLRVTWTTVGGKSYVVQTNGDVSNGFADFSPLISASSAGESVTNFVDPDAATNGHRYYRVRLQH